MQLDRRYLDGYELSLISALGAEILDCSDDISMRRLYIRLAHIQRKSINLHFNAQDVIKACNEIIQYAENVKISVMKIGE